MMDCNRSRESIMEQLNRVVHRFPDLNLEDFDRMVKEGEIQVFPLANGSVMVGRITNGTVRIIAAAGLLYELLEFEPVFCNWYRDHGCNEVTLGGRGKAWFKYLEAHGYKKTIKDSELVKVL